MKRTACYRAVYALSSKYKIAAMCRVLNIKRTSYYKWLRTAKSCKDAFYAKLIQEIQNNTKQTYGYRRIGLALLREHGMVINHKKVLRIMEKYNLLSVIRRKYIYKGSQVLHKYENLFHRNFKAANPNEKWCTDISYIITPQGRLYLSCIKDCYDKSIVSYRYSSRMDMNLVTSTIKQAAAKEKVASGLQLHSDQGFQYTSHEYNSLTKEYTITPSMSRAGTPIDNAPIESFFSILKTECIYLEKPKTIQEAKECIDDFIDYYNNDRIQLNSGQTPNEIRKKYQLQASL